MASVVSLKEAARLTGLTTRQIGDLVAQRNLTIERDPVTGEKGIYPHTLRGVNGYRPPDPPPSLKPPPPSPPKPEPWTPGPAELAALIKLDDRGRAVAMADLKRRHPHLDAWFRDNPLPPVFRKAQPPPPPQAKAEPPPPPPPTEPPPDWRMSWQFDLHSRQVPPRPAAPKPEPPKPTPRAEPPPVPVSQPAPESLGRLIFSVLGLILTGLTGSTRTALISAFRKSRRLIVSVLAAVVFAVTCLVAEALFVSHNVRPPKTLPRTVHPRASGPARHHHAPSVTPRPRYPSVLVPSPYLPPLLPPGAGRQNPFNEANPPYPY